MSTSEMSDLPDLPDLPTFDDADLRKAVRRALVRTVATVLAVLLLADVGLKVAKASVDAALGRPSINEALTILQLGHPDMVVQQGSTSQDRVTASLTPLTATGQGGGTTTFTVSRSLFGTLHFNGSFRTEQGPLTDALANFGQGPLPNKQAQAAALHSLPANVALAVVIRFATPLQPERAYERLQAAEVDSGKPLFGDAPTSHPSVALFPVAWGFGSDFTGDTRNAQNSGIYNEYLRELRSWVSQHHKASAHQWELQGVDMNRVRAAAREGLVHGAIATDVTTAEALKLLADPSVTQVAVTNVELVPPTT